MMNLAAWSSCAVSEPADTLQQQDNETEYNDVSGATLHHYEKASASLHCLKDTPGEPVCD